MAKACWHQFVNIQVGSGARGANSGWLWGPTGPACNAEWLRHRAERCFGTATRKRHRLWSMAVKAEHAERQWQLPVLTGLFLKIYLIWLSAKSPPTHVNLRFFSRFWLGFRGRSPILLKIVPKARNFRANERRESLFSSPSEAESQEYLTRAYFSQDFGLGFYINAKKSWKSSPKSLIKILTKMRNSTLLFRTIY